MKPGDSHAYFQPEKAPDKLVIFMFETKPLNAFGGKTNEKKKIRQYGT